MHKSFLLATAALALAGVTTLAAENAPQNATAGASTFVNVPNDNMLSSNIVGLDVYNDQNTSIGKIEDIAFDGLKRTMSGYILSVGGFLGMGSHYVAVDPGALKISYDENKKAWRASMNA